MCYFLQTKSKRYGCMAKIFTFHFASGDLIWPDQDIKSSLLPFSVNFEIMLTRPRENEHMRK